MAISRSCKHLVQVLLRKSIRRDKKLDAVIGTEVVSFGQRGASDYLLHKNRRRKILYVNRHNRSRSNGDSGKKENWRESGMYTPGFWSRWVLWNLPDLRASLRNTEERFCIRIETDPSVKSFTKNRKRRS